LKKGDEGGFEISPTPLYKRGEGTPLPFPSPL
jgi:hypothetical protein